MRKEQPIGKYLSMFQAEIHALSSALTTAIASRVLQFWAELKHSQL